jgi:very-short-patch-repair endonuclease
VGQPFAAKLTRIEEVPHILEVADSDAERALSALAGRQRGMITRAQLAALGIGPGAVAHRVARSRLHRQFRGVYLVGQPVAPVGGREVAALLSCRRPTILSHQSLVALAGLLPPPEEVHLTAVSGHLRGQPGLRIHQTRTVRRAELVSWCGLPVTTPVRALIDLAAARHPAIERVVSDAHARGLVTPSGLQGALDQHRGQAGVPVLREIAGAERRGYTRSEHEQRLRQLCRAAGLPAPVTNRRVAGWEVDFLWPAHGVVVEVDTFRTHGSARQFQIDRRKQVALVAAGLAVLRYTGRALHGDPLPVIGSLGQTLGAAAQKLSSSD